ncbi:hypothetical protein H1R20_g1354, partial [Candolleomyces eurysporus]
MVTRIGKGVAPVQDNDGSINMRAEGKGQALLISLHICEDWFDVFDDENRPLLTEREIQRNPATIVTDVDTLDITQVARNSTGVLMTEKRQNRWHLREILVKDKNNKACLDIVDRALFIVCLDDAAPENLADLCSNFLCGPYRLEAQCQFKNTLCVHALANLLLQPPQQHD